MANNIFNVDLPAPTVVSDNSGATRAAATQQYGANIASALGALAPFVSSGIDLAREKKAESLVEKDVAALASNLTTFGARGEVEYAGKDAATLLAAEKVHGQIKNTVFDNDLQKAAQSGAVGALEKEITRLKSAMDGGVVPRHVAIARLEAITSGAVAKAPHLAKEIMSVTDRYFGAGISSYSAHKALFQESGAEKAAAKKAAEKAALDDWMFKQTIEYGVKQLGLPAETVAAIRSSDSARWTRMQEQAMEDKQLSLAVERSENEVKRRTAEGTLKDSDISLATTNQAISDSNKIKNSLATGIAKLFGNKDVAGVSYTDFVTPEGVLNPAFRANEDSISKLMATSSQQMADVWEKQITSYRQRATEAKVPPTIIDTTENRMRQQQAAMATAMQKNPSQFVLYMAAVEKTAKERGTEAKQNLDILRSILDAEGMKTIAARYIADPESTRRLFPETTALYEKLLSNGQSIYTNYTGVALVTKDMREGRRNPEDVGANATDVEKVAAVDTVETAVKEVAQPGVPKNAAEQNEVAANLGHVAGSPNHAIKLLSTPSGATHFKQKFDALPPEAQEVVGQRALRALQRITDPRGPVIASIKDSIRRSRGSETAIDPKEFIIVDGQITYKPLKEQMLEKGSTVVRAPGNIVGSWLNKDAVVAALAPINASLRMLSLTTQVAKDSTVGYNDVAKQVVEQLVAKMSETGIRPIIGAQR